MNRKNYSILFISLLIITSSIMAFNLVKSNPNSSVPTRGTEQKVSENTNIRGEANDFNKYWYQGKAEVSRYELTQGRYGEVHEGEAVLIFVTEDFRTDKQVKLESYESREQATPILKLNALRKFPTGIYDYSVMTSIFKPIDLDKYPNALKISFSSQEWCGHVYSQLNLKNKKYQVTGHSYFESEADEQYNIPQAYLEDEIWNLIRINPKALPLGKIEMIPSAMYRVLGHKKGTVEKVQTSLDTYRERTYKGENLMVYKIKYTKTNRQLHIFFEKDFPHQIEAWEEKKTAGRGTEILTKAVRTHSKLTDYWAKNSAKDVELRKELGL